MDYNLIAAQVLESALIFLRSTNEGVKLLQVSKTSRWMHQMNIENQTIDAALQTLCGGAYDFVNKALEMVSHLVRKLKSPMMERGAHKILIVY